MRGVRSSGRLRAQPNSDVPLLERAMMLAEKRAEMPAIGTSASKPNSFIDFSDNHIIDSAISLGVSLGQSHSECIKAAALLKDVEAQRILTMLKGTDQLEGKNGNNTSCLVVSRASDLCDDLEGDDDFMCDEDECWTTVGVSVGLFSCSLFWPIWPSPVLTYIRCFYLCNPKIRESSSLQPPSTSG